MDLESQQPATSGPRIPPRPVEVPIKTLDRKSDEWSLYHYAWDLMYWLYVGGLKIAAVAEQFLVRRPKELSDVYQARIQRFTYQNHAGAAVDFYRSALFEVKPQMAPEVPPGQESAPKMKEEDSAFYNALDQNCNRNNLPMLEFMREFFGNMVTYGRAAALVDLPKRRSDLLTAQDEKNAGQDNAFLVQIDPRQLINMGRAEDGTLDWVIYSLRRYEQPDPLDAIQVMDYWYMFDRKNYYVYRYAVTEPSLQKPSAQMTNELVNKAPDDAVATLIDFGPHAHSHLNQVPIIYYELPEGLWFMNRAFLAAKDHLNTDNALGWALMMAALAMPVVMTDGEFTPVLSEAGFIKLPANGKYAWSEPEGKSFSHLADRGRSLIEEIYRAFYLVAQGRTTNSTAAAASAASKQQDMAPSKKVMNLFGDIMRSIYQLTYNYISMARQDGLTWDARGFEFREDPPDAELETVALADALYIPSDIFEHELYKKAVRAALPNANRAVISQIDAEIEKAPNKMTRMQQQQETQANQLVQNRVLNTAFPRKDI